MYPRFRPEFTGYEMVMSFFKIVENYQITEEFKKNVYNFPDKSICAFFNSGRGALFHILQTLKQKKVYVQMYTGHSVFKAIKLTDKELIPLEINLNDFGIDTEYLNQYIEPDSIIIATHLFGIPCKIKEIIEIARKNNCIVIEDACAAIGGFHSGRALGSFGDIAFYSFDFSKTIPACKGSLAVINNKRLYDSFRRWTIVENCKYIDLFSIKTLLNGILLNVLTRPIVYDNLLLRFLFDKNKPFYDDGSYKLILDSHFNRGMSRIRLALLYLQLKKFPDIKKRRQKVVDNYYKHLSEIKSIQLFKYDKDDDLVLLTFPLLLKRKNKLEVYKQFLSQGIDLGWTFSYVNKTNHTDNFYLTNCHEASVRTLNLPVYSHMEDTDISYIIDAAKKIL